MSFFFGFAFVSITLINIIVCAEWLQRRFSIHPEIARKLVHATMGLTLLPLPWLFTEKWQGICTAAMGALLLLALNYLPLFKRWSVALNAVQRKTTGHYYFVAGALATFLIAHAHRLIYVIAVLILSFADALSGLIGIFKGRFKCWGNDKTLEGSLAFFISSFLLAGLLLCLSEQYPMIYTFLLSFVIAMSGMMVEAMFTRGSDNFCIPISVYGAMQLGSNLNIWSLLFVSMIMSAAITVLIVKRYRSHIASLPIQIIKPLHVPALSSYQLCSNSEVL
jgi:phytol kinase